jgi:beta-glucanase (GH16 family)
VENGLLIITARKEDLTTATDYGGQHYTSARLITNNKASWTYGFYEVRAKLPCGPGTWPAIWMLGTGGRWPDDGELDIMEQTGADPTTILGTTHTTNSGGPGIGGRTTVADACSAFHSYQMTWTADYVAFGIDDVNYFRYDNPKTGNTRDWPFDTPQYLILNIAIGGTLGGNVDDNIFPVQMVVDHVRIYQSKP